MMKNLQKTKYGMLYIGLIVASFYWLVETGLHAFVFEKTDIISQLIPRNINELWMRSVTTLIIVLFGIFAHFKTNKLRICHARGMLVQKQLNVALTKVLSGFIPICANCKKIRLEDANPREQNSWQQIEFYLSKITDAEFSHSICPDCAKKLYGDTYG
jgi:hypothetical protein